MRTLSAPIRTLNRDTRRLPMGAAALCAITLVTSAPLVMSAPAHAQELTEQRRMDVARRLGESTVSVVSGPSTGSGFVTGERGWVVTNSHVVRPAARHGVQVRFSSGTTRRAIVLFDSPDHDLAVLALEGQTPARPLPLADSERVAVGQTVLAFGSPFGLDGTLTQGIVSALRDVPAGSSLGGGAVRRLIQTDAPINPGNSGGPLVNTAGEVIGVNTAILSRTGGSHGIGFAVPSVHVRALLDEATRRERTAVAGARPEALPTPQHPRDVPTPQSLQSTQPQGPDARPANGAFLGILGDDYRGRGFAGVRIRQVVPGSPAETAGLAGSADPAPPAIEQLGLPWTGHIIVAVDGRPTPSMSHLQHALEGRRPGQRAILTVTVAGALSGQTVVTLGRTPLDEEEPSPTRRRRRE